MKKKWRIAVLLGVMAVLAAVILILWQDSALGEPPSAAQTFDQSPEDLQMEPAWDCPPALFWDDQMYYYSGEEIDPVSLNGNVVGEVSSIVAPTEMPAQHGEANMEILGASILLHGNNVAVYVDADWKADTWLLFRCEDHRDSDILSPMCPKVIIRDGRKYYYANEIIDPSTLAPDQAAEKTTVSYGDDLAVYVDDQWLTDTWVLYQCEACWQK